MVLFIEIKLLGRFLTDILASNKLTLEVIFRRIKIRQLDSSKSKNATRKIG